MDATLTRKLFDKNLKGCASLLLQISNEDITTLYLTDNNENIVYDGHTYVPAFFTITLAEQAENAEGEAQFTMGCVDLSIIEMIRSVDYLKIKFIATYYEDGDISVMDGYEMKLKDMSWDAVSASGSLYWDNVLPLSFGGEFTPTSTPGMT